LANLRVLEGRTECCRIAHQIGFSNDLDGAVDASDFQVHIEGLRFADVQVEFHADGAKSTVNRVERHLTDGQSGKQEHTCSVSGNFTM
jgi:hypothetical protein